MQMGNIVNPFFNLYIPAILDQKSQEDLGLFKNMKIFRM